MLNFFEPWWRQCRIENGYSVGSLRKQRNRASPLDCWRRALCRRDDRQWEHRTRPPRIRLFSRRRTLMRLQRALELKRSDQKPQRARDQNSAFQRVVVVPARTQERQIVHCYLDNYRYHFWNRVVSLDIEEVHDLQGSSVPRYPVVAKNK